MQHSQIILCFLMGLQSFRPCWGREEEEVGYQDPLDGKTLQAAVTGRVEDDREGLVGGLHVAKFNLVLEKGWRRFGGAPQELHQRGWG